MALVVRRNRHEEAMNRLSTLGFASVLAAVTSALSGCVVHADGGVVAGDQLSAQFLLTWATVDASTKPPRITIGSSGQEVGTVQGIFQLEGDKLTICVSEEGQPLPSEVPSVPGTEWTVYHLRALAHR